MKFSYPQSLLLHLSLVLFPFCILTESSTPPQSVLDADGHQLQAGAKYYIVPAVRGTGNVNGGGGLALSAKDISCPFYVMQENLESSNGLPTRFLPADTNVIVITLSNDLNIAFNAATICVQSTAWKVGDFDGKTGRRYVMSNGVIGNNTGGGGGGVSSWFKIEKAAGGGNNNGYYYKIVYCPSACGSCKVVCRDLGVYSENGKRWVGLSDDPLLVLFKKAY